ncbi:11108_t:CDS:2 [Funneliformis mosseae]|uniref:11108_t:CDS:1 n=1 Tax=Funneliformis mosseae TaxID=27381 RepID=A0A9N8VWS6_FUNMO|nr:11108_t:CDS:2 [Funneliformis mosseae]
MNRFSDGKIHTYVKTMDTGAASIKAVDNITINITFPAASHFQYANQLELNEQLEM